ncbi:MAG: glycosyltransferase [Rhodocyclaceae bacterium]|nr:glycosyltransferase [Rhodocyclaceae bacterium]
MKPDVVHCHDTLVLPLGVIVKLFTRATLIYDAHELESDRNGLTELQGRLTLWVERWLWQFVDALIVVNPSIQTCTLIMWALNRQL